MEIKDVIVKGLTYTGDNVDFDYVTKAGQDKNVNVESELVQSAILRGETPIEAGTIPIKIKPIVINGISFSPVIRMPYMYSAGKSATWDGKTPEYIVNIMNRQGNKWQAFNRTGQQVLLTEAEIVNNPTWIVTINKFCDVLPNDLNYFDYVLPASKVLTFNDILKINGQMGTTEKAPDNYIPTLGLSNRYNVYLFTNQYNNVVNEVYVYKSLYDFLIDLDNGVGAYIHCDKEYQTILNAINVL